MQERFPKGQKRDRRQDEADETWETIEEGSMPPPYYTLFGLPKDARLSDAELRTLLDGVAATPGPSDRR